MKNNNKKSLQQKRQIGFSLIELMIAMLIGLFLLAGITTSYISSKKSSIKVDEMSKIEDNGRLALEVLTNAIEHTGYTPPQNALNFFPDAFINNKSEVASVTCPGGKESVENPGLFSNERLTKNKVGGDQIALMYHGDSRIFSDCSGAELPVECHSEAPAALGLGGSGSNKSIIYNAFFLEKNKVKNTFLLKCAGSRDKKVQTIADGIENMQFLYGLDETDDGGANRFVNASNIVTSGGNWGQVVSVQIALLVRSDKPVKPKKEKITYTLLDQVYTPTKADRYQRAVFTTTVQIRNRI